ncbi:hypothetical protein Tco_1047281, partial [Tanacetum coccineum]
GSRGESLWEECDDSGVDVLRFHTCLTDILGFLGKLEWWFEQDIDDEGEEDEEDRVGDECQLDAVGRRVKDTEKEADSKVSFPLLAVPYR